MSQPLPCPLSDLAWVRPDGDRLDLDGTPGWFWRAPDGLVLACAVEPAHAGPAWLVRASLLLAASADALPYALWREGGRYWLWRRYPSGSAADEVGPELENQLALARWLADVAPRRESLSLRQAARLA
ncbi:hypothetical protein [Paludibacterium yongneupense]|uniref:hypothetical protein n=1 Tax=Paludibacterium yongneupense TaxID=400061 RepID=UPI00048D290E|nr:hypothetical protein [Paludibacterium yongneupense]